MDVTSLRGFATGTKSMVTRFSFGGREEIRGVDASGKTCTLTRSAGVGADFSAALAAACLRPSRVKAAAKTTATLRTAR